MVASRLLPVCLVPVWLAAGIFPSPASAQDQPADRPSVQAVMLKGDARPAIDGKVDDEVWNSVVPFMTFIQQEPDEGQPATERTEVRFLVDAKNLYIGVIAFDREPDRIVVSQSRRDAD